MSNEFQPDLDAIAAIAAVPTMLTVVSHVTGMRFSAIARVTPERWVCLAANDLIGFGLKPGGELKIETTICHEIRQAREAVIIDHVAEDELYANHHTPAIYGFQSYISMPIFLSDGSFYGTLCALDPKPAKVKDPGIIGMFRLFADLIGIHLENAKRLVTAETSLIDAKTAAELQEQFLAVLGHDLRNPLAAIAAGAKLLRKTALDERAQMLVGMMEQSTTRMGALIEDVIDFSRSRLGGGALPLTRSAEPIEPMLMQVVDEMRAMHPERTIEAEFHINKAIFADRQRIARLLSNLLGNAINYSPPDSAVLVRAQTYGSFALSVTNHGPAIPSTQLENLFQPYVRGKGDNNLQGLGLGLYIVSQIATAHAGTIDVTSTDEATRFTFQMPLIPTERELAFPPTAATPN